MPIAWTIAGSDPSCHAGLQTDLKTFHALGVQGCSITTAITAQNNAYVNQVHYLSVENIAAQLTSLENHFRANAIKIGMLGTKENCALMAPFLKNTSGKIILDPVMTSSTGHSLFTGQDYLIHLFKLFPNIDLLTPNLDETEIIVNHKINSHSEIKSAANDILSLGVKNVFIKGGHFNNDLFSQDYWTNGKESFWLASKRHPQHYRGTGCTLSSAITACLALGYTIKDAIVIAKMYLNQCMRLSHIPNYLAHTQWPENQEDLPYLSDKPIHSLPKKFAECNTTPLGLYPIVDSIELMHTLLRLGINTIQLRIKNKAGHELETCIQDAVYLANKYSARLFINDYWELAIKYKAYGVHLGQEDILQANIEKIYAAGLRLGISTHCYHEVAHAHRFNPSYLACGPIYPTTSKIMPFAPQGLEQLACWRRTLHYPLVAIGGINFERLPEIRATKVDGFAMISAVEKLL